MSNLATMYGGSPNTASMMMGQSHFDDRQRKAADLKSLMMKNEQDAVMNPLEAQHKQGQIAQQAAMLPGIQGQAQSQAVQGQMDTTMMQARLASEFSKLATQLGKDGMEQLGQEGERLSQGVALLKNYPAAAHKEVFTKYLQQTGGNLQSPMAQSLMKLPAHEFAQGLEVMGKSMATAGSKFQQDRSMQKDRLDSNERIQKDHDKTRLDIAEKQKEAKLAAGQARVKEASALTVDKAIAKLEMIPDEDRTPAEWKALQKLQAFSLTKSAAGANATTPTVLGQATPMQNASAAAESLTPTQRPQAPAAPSGGGDIAALAKKQGLSYEPEKYEYRVINGTLKRKPK